MVQLGVCPKGPGLATHLQQPTWATLLHSYVAQHAACPVTVVHCGPPGDGRRNSIGAGFRKGLEKLAMLPGAKTALFGRGGHANAVAQQPGKKPFDIDVRSGVSSRLLTCFAGRRFGLTQRM